MKIIIGLYLYNPPPPPLVINLQSLLSLVAFCFLFSFSLCSVWGVSFGFCRLSMIHHMRSAVSLEMGYIFSDLMGMRDKENLSFCSLEEKETQEKGKAISCQSSSVLRVC